MGNWKYALLYRPLHYLDTCSLQIMTTIVSTTAAPLTTIVNSSPQCAILLLLARRELIKIYIANCQIIIKDRVWIQVCCFSSLSGATKGNIYKIYRICKGERGIFCGLFFWEGIQEVVVNI